MNAELYESLKDAYSILSRAEIGCCGAGMPIYKFVSDARRHIQAQLDAIEQPIIAQEAGPVEAWSLSDRLSGGVAVEQD